MEKARRPTGGLAIWRGEEYILSFFLRLTIFKWPRNILENRNLTAVFAELFIQTAPLENNNTPENSLQKSSFQYEENFRDKYPPTLRTRDGHIVRSRAEVIIDNTLYEYQLAHAYERKLPVEEDLYSDFFLNSKNVYIDYWGMEKDPKYALRKERKLEIYGKYSFNLIELFDNDIANLDDSAQKIT